MADSRRGCLFKRGRHYELNEPANFRSQTWNGVRNKIAIAQHQRVTIGRRLKVAGRTTFGCFDDTRPRRLQQAVPESAPASAVGNTLDVTVFVR